MRMTQEEYDALQRRRKDPLQEVILSHGFTGGKVPKKKAAAGKWQGGNLRLILPFKLPTWNRLLALNPWQRKKVRDWLHLRISECIQSGSASQTATGYQLKLFLTDSCIQEYYAMMDPSTSRRSATAKKKRRKMKPS